MNEISDHGAGGLCFATWSGVTIKKLTSFFCIVLSLLLSGPASAEMNTDLLRFEANDQSKLNGQHAQKLDDFHYVFIGGYFNELVRAEYFDLNIRTLQDLGAQAVSRFFPSSFVAASKNREIIRDQLKKLFVQGGSRPIVLIGHSKGGLESLATILEYPQLVDKGIVSDVILFQAPIGGNHLLDSQGLAKRLLANSLFLLSGFSSLQTPAIRAIIVDKIRKLPQAQRERLSRVVKYVVSHESVSRMGRALQWASTLTPMTQKYDGLVAQQDMWIPHFGVILGDIKNADHLELVLSRKSVIADNISPERVRAFTKSLITNLFKSHNPENLEYRRLTEAQTESRGAPLLCRLAL